MKILNEGYNSGRFAVRAQGKYIWIKDVCGKTRKCLDFALGGGVHIFGHRPKFIIDAVNKQMALGNHYAMPSVAALYFAKAFEKHSPLTSLIFCSSGSEAVMRAFRIARIQTERPTVAIFEGSWHGSYDGTLSIDYNVGSHQSILRLPYSDECFEFLNRRSDIAMVFIEPFQGSRPEYNHAFLKHLYTYCKNKNILIGFDEIISGFRYPGINHYHLAPDLATYGKIAGGGFPIGIVAGAKIPTGFLGGTFSANPMSMAVGVEVLKRITGTITNKLDALGLRLRNGARSIIMGVGSFNRIKKELDLQRIREELFQKNIYIGSNGLVFLSTEHTMEDVDKLVNVLNGAK